MIHQISWSTRVQLLDKCRRCGGGKQVTDDEGKSVDCPECGGTGDRITEVNMREFVDYIGEQIAREVRLHRGR